MKNDPQDYERAVAERAASTDAIIASDARKIVVVAGPGTGKTTLFAKLLARRDGHRLTLSFINVLVDDLSVSLYGLGDVSTLHGFSIGLLRGFRGEAKMYPLFENVMREDFELITAKTADFRTMFHTFEADVDAMKFYDERRKYYGNYYGFADAIWALATHLTKNPRDIPKYSQIVVDEFQDFNKTEVILIDLLAQNSPVLLAGDDDQALYMGLREASPQHIREKHGDTAPDYSPFGLPFCSRSTLVIVEAVNDIVAMAAKNGLMQGRIPKEYRYFPCAAKDAESEQSPWIVYSQQFQGELAFFVQKELKKIASVDRSSFSVLVLAPPQMTKSIPKIADSLRKRGFRKTNHAGPSLVGSVLLEGLRMVIDDRDNNLGWRIAAKQLLPEDDFAQIIAKSADGTSISKLLPATTREEIRQLTKTLRIIRDGKEAPEADIASLMKRLGHNPFDLVVEAVREFVATNDANVIPRALRDIPITITNVIGSKGLAADYVFITHFDDQFYSEDGKGAVADRQVFNLLVALTRARKKAFLISSKDIEPTLLGWIDGSRVKRQFDAPHAKAAGARKAPPMAE